MVEFDQIALGIVLGLAILFGVLWWALRPMLYPKKRPSGAARHAGRSTGGWDDTNASSGYGASDHGGGDSGGHVGGY